MFLATFSVTSNLLVITSYFRCINCTPAEIFTFFFNSFRSFIELTYEAHHVKVEEIEPLNDV